jgi:hypothetical protein
MMAQALRYAESLTEQQGSQASRRRLLTFAGRSVAEGAERSGYP